MKFSNYVIFAVALVIGACVVAAQNRGAPEEVSGVFIDRERVDDRPLVLVADENAGVYFACDDGDTKQGTTIHAPLVKHFEIVDCREVKIRGAAVATDFESVASYASGEYLMLSESLMALIVGHGAIINPTRFAFAEGALVVQYHNAYSQIGGRGLEGLATKADIADDMAIKVAAVWEGGFPESGRMPLELSGASFELQNEEFKPAIIHFSANLPPADGSIVEVEHNKVGIEIRVEVPKPADEQIFRAPDLVWAETSEAVREARSVGHDAEFILLISSERSGAKSCPGNERFKYTCLWEVTDQGNSTGRSLDIKDILQVHNLPTLRECANWEGLAWYGADELILVNDNKNRTGGRPFEQVPLTALIVQGPDEWNQGKACPAMAGRQRGEVEGN